MDNFRLNLEQTIIGACLLENGYSRVAGVLIARNFSQSDPYNHGLVFEAIQRLYPTRPVDLITVTHEIGKIGYASYLAECAAKVCSSDNLRYHAFILLQLSMSDALVRALDDARGRHISITTHAAVQEIIDQCLDCSNDILEIYQNALSYLERIGAEEYVIDEIRKIQDGFEKKINSIKAQVHVEVLITNLNQLSNVVSDVITRLALNRLIELTKATLTKGKVSHDTLDALNKINV